MWCQFQMKEFKKSIQIFFIDISEYDDDNDDKRTIKISYNFTYLY